MQVRKNSLAPFLILVLNFYPDNFYPGSLYTRLSRQNYVKHVSDETIFCLIFSAHPHLSLVILLFNTYIINRSGLSRCRLATRNCTRSLYRNLINRRRIKYVDVTGKKCNSRDKSAKLCFQNGSLLPFLFLSLSLFAVSLVRPNWILIYLSADQECFNALAFILLALLGIHHRKTYAS